MDTNDGIRMKRPVHPGVFVRLIVLDPLGLSVTAAAKALGVTRPALSALLNGRASLSPDMAIRLDKAFDIDMETLMNMQNAYDIAEARERKADIKVARYNPKQARGEPRVGVR
ncbi:MAG: HigA family addiction module antitoxin [Alphaproteobacteria bacterium]